MGSTISFPQRREIAAEGPELVVVEGTAGEREPLDLGVAAADQTRVAVSEVERRVGGEHVEVARPLDVGDPGALGLREDDGQRMVVVSATAVLGVDGLGCVGVRRHPARERNGSWTPGRS